MILQNARFGVKVERFGDKRKHMYKIMREDALCLVKCGTRIIPLNYIDSKIEIFSPDETQQVNAEGCFYITAETIDPYHIIVDIF